MVTTLGPGKFYGSSLPRPRLYTDVKFNDERVDPPVSVTDPLMAWAEEARTSMGGLNDTRHRLQGRIEGSIEKLREQPETIFDESPKTQKSSDKDKNEGGFSETPSPPPVPVAIKRRRLIVLLDEEDEEVKRELVKNLGDDFERVARESGISKTESDKANAGVEGVEEGKGKIGKKRLFKRGRRVGEGL